MTTVFICRMTCWQKRPRRSSHSMLANFCTVLFMFFKATAVGSVAPRLPEAQCNWFGGRSTVASPSVKNVMGSVFLGAVHRGLTLRTRTRILDTPNWLRGLVVVAVWRRKPSPSIDVRPSALRTADRNTQCGCRGVSPPVFREGHAIALRARRTYRSPRFLLPTW